MHWYLDIIKKYTLFTGRASRKEYWMFVLMNTLILILMSIVLSIIGLRPDAKEIVEGIYSLAVFLPTFALTFRRLHDIGKSGWWAGAGLIYMALFFALISIAMFQSALFFVVIIFMVPLFVYSIVLFIFTVQASQIGDNKYGPHPYGIQIQTAPLSDASQKSSSDVSVQELELPADTLVEEKSIDSTPISQNKN